MLTILNGTREGGSFQMAPEGKVDDSLLNYSAVNLISRPQMLRALVAYMNGSQDRLPYIQSGIFKSLELNADRPLILHSDGEILAGLDSQVTHLSIQCIPQAIRLVRD
jgi:diacylglycerol kinase family enzyme